jgi:hypothetical protein
MPGRQSGKGKKPRSRPPGSAQIASDKGDRALRQLPPTDTDTAELDRNGTIVPLRRNGKPVRIPKGYK